MITDKSNNSHGGWLEEDLAYQSRLLFLSFEIRVLNLLVALIVAVAIKKIWDVNISTQALLTYFAWMVTSALYLLPFRPKSANNKKKLDRIHFSYYFFGVFYATMLVHYLGGGEWVAVIAYFFDLIYANVLMTRIRGAAVTAMAMAAYFLSVLLEYRGIIPHYTVFQLTPGMYRNYDYMVSTNLVITGMLFVLISYGTGLFLRVKEEREKSLIESKNRFAMKSEQLEEILLKLKRNIAENTYIKRAAMGFVEKKEFEIGQTKCDLERQIEKLRKTQQSMFFMIEDLNSMSAQLKDARDNLEQKVRVRSDELLNISRKLHRSERLAFLGKLAGSVTHELRNPMAVLKNAIYFLKTKLKDTEDKKVAHYIRVIEREIMLIDSIIEDIMGFAKTRSPQLEKTDLGFLAGNIISMLDIPEEVKVVTEFQEVPKVEVDPGQITHALVNIANNAIMAMNGSGTLAFRVLNTGEEVCVEIEDTGSGIPPEQRDLIFEPLYSSKPKGTGLGLPIAKMMMENHDGRIEFDSELGKGTVFRLFFPVKIRKRGDVA